MGILGKIKSSSLFNNNKWKRGDDLTLASTCDSCDEVRQRDSFEELLDRVPLQPLQQVATDDDVDGDGECDSSMQNSNILSLYTKSITDEPKIGAELSLGVASTTLTHTFPHLDEMAYSEVSQEVIASFPANVEFDCGDCGDRIVVDTVEFPERSNLDFPDPDMAIYVSSSDSSTDEEVIGLEIDTSFQQIKEEPILSPSLPLETYTPPTLNRRLGTGQYDCLAHIFHENLATLYEQDSEASTYGEIEEQQKNVERADEINMRARWEYALKMMLPQSRSPSPRRTDDTAEI